MITECVLPDGMTWEQYASSAWKLTKVDKNGTHFYFDGRCPKCGGTGYIYGYERVMGGVCFKCGGSGKGNVIIKVRTPEYAKKLAERRLAKARKEAPERNAKAFKRWGLSEDGHAYIVLGNTFEIKDALKEAGARYDGLLGWHFTEPTQAYPVFDLAPDTVICDAKTFLRLENDGHYSIVETQAVTAFLRDVQNAYRAKHTTKKHIGKVGDKLDIQAVLKRRSSYETHFGYRTQTVWIYTFADADGNEMVWKTGTWTEIEQGDAVKLTGTVKEHSAFRGIPQTVLTRCKIAKEG